MYFKIYFKPKDGNRQIRIPVKECQKGLNSFNHRVIGPNNPYHDKFSHYNLSQIQGMRLDPTTQEYYLDDRAIPYITVSAYNDAEFISKYLDGLHHGNNNFFGFVFDYAEYQEFKVNKRYDIIVTTSPILLKVNDRKISVEDEDFLEHLTEHCIKKLRHAGIEDETFGLVLRRPDRAKKKLVWVGNTWNICSSVSLRVYGKPETRRALYELGFGGSTGSGFGSIKIFQ